MPSPAATGQMIADALKRPGGSKLVPDRYVYFDDFFECDYVVDLKLSAESNPTAKFVEATSAPTGARGIWAVTQVPADSSGNANISISADEPGGVLAILTNNASDATNDSMSCQLTGSAFKTSTSKSMGFEARFKVNDADTCDWIVGLCEVDTALMAGVAGGLYFRAADGTADQNIMYVVENSSTETTADTTVDIADDTFVKVRMETQFRDHVDVYVDDTFRARVTTNIPTSALTPSLEIINGSDAASTLEVDYFLAWGDR